MAQASGTAQMASQAVVTVGGVLLVEVDGRRCGLPAQAVLELHRMVASTPLPTGPEVLDGVIDAHGTVIAVLDLRARLGLARRPATPADHLVLLQVAERVVAVRVDRVVDLVSLPAGALPPVVDVLVGPHLQGVVRLEDGLLFVHDVDAFLSDEHAAALDQALAALAVARSSGS